jgi:hypothetical protein
MLLLRTYLGSNPFAPVGLAQWMVEWVVEWMVEWVVEWGSASWISLR